MLRRFLLPALMLSTTSLVACSDDLIVEPGAPAVHGLISLDVDVDPAEWTTVELRLAATADLASDDPSEGEGYGNYEDLAEVEFPFEYWVGGSFGTSPHSEWRVLAWLTDEDAEGTFWEEAPAGSPWAEEVVDLGDCSQGCGSVEIDLILAW